MKKLLLLAAVAMLAAAPAKADPTFSTDFTIDHCSQTCGPAGTVFGTITLTDTAFGVDFDVAVKNGAKFNFNGNGLNTFNFSLDKTITAADIFNLTAGYTFGTGGHQDGFGTFLDDTDDSLHGTSAADLMFTVKGIDFSDFLKSTGGNPNVFFAIDVLGPNGKTGLIGSEFSGNVINPTVTPTPLPGAVWMFGAGLGGLGLLMRRKQKHKLDATAAA